MGSPQEAVQIVNAVVGFEKAKQRIPSHLKDTHPYSSLALWTFYLDTHHTPEGESCPYCKLFDGQTFTGTQLRTVFPDHYFVGDDIYPDVHATLWGKKGTCACLLIREPDKGSHVTLSIWSGVGGDWRDKPNVELNR